MTINESLDGWMPSSTYGQIVGIIFVIGLIACMIVGVIGCLKHLKRFLDRLEDIQERKLLKEETWHQQEDENWRRVNPEYLRRIKELEQTCKANQETIAILKQDIKNRDIFMEKVKVKDLYLYAMEGVYKNEEV